MSRHLHPIEALILAAMAVFWAARVLTVAVVAMALLLAGWSPLRRTTAKGQQEAPSSLLAVVLEQPNRSAIA